MYKDIPIVEPLEIKLCSRCQCYEISLYNIKHAELCDYFYFRGFEAPKMGYSSVSKVNDTYYLKILCEVLGVPHRAFHVSGISGHYWDIFLPDEIASLIDIYHIKEGYAGMDLEEYIMTIVMKDSNERT